jgi:hypothetical protein
VIDGYRAQGQSVGVRADAIFGRPAFYEALEQQGVAYTDMFSNLSGARTWVEIANPELDGIEHPTMRLNEWTAARRPL